MKKYAVVFLGLFLLVLSGCGLLFGPDSDKGKTGGSSDTKPTEKITKLTISNQSSKSLSKVKYSGYSASPSLLSPGDSCTIEIRNEQGEGAIFFDLGSQTFKTNDVITIATGKSQKFTFHDTTVILDSKGKEKTLGNYDDKIILTVINNSSKKLTGIAYSGKNPADIRDLTAGKSCTIKLDTDTGSGAITFKIGKNELLTKETYALQKGDTQTVTLTDSSVVIDPMGLEKSLSDFFDDTVLTVKNESMYTLTAITYSGKSPSGNATLSRYSSCEIYFEQAGSGAISFEIEGKAVKTKEAISLNREERKEFVISDDTEIIAIESGVVTTVKGLYPDTILTVKNISGKVLKNIKYCGTGLEGSATALNAGDSANINIGKQAGSGSIYFTYNGITYKTVEEITIAKGSTASFQLLGATLVKVPYYNGGVSKRISDL